ncbi:serine phosphatase RsbU (regulator of sigma subunit)/anti-sigma regulatory factor (Ser/Thr protein kinase) [Streptomyces sp. 3330]|uniref:SpoIIE family protein phosphatase n=1 Tax=Streptomyces sp. 3330 TaxID=2817755 RepID=UPI00285852E8|nr:SpoIIE family protein phosphatase [Streptomyces sp. 3330]MDR6979608.1 serine phosphatase RsbU (regulator of sigma subunit)/anti-sigma regulatory factor (Ser/Thr protein kinase) [Streptomyces sp. 3330]
MDLTAAGLVSRVVRELGSRADELTAEVERDLRRELPELWDDPDIARMVAENVADHVAAGLFGLEHAIAPGRIAPPPADEERARRLARHGIPLGSMLRAFRLAQTVVLDRLLAEMPRYSDDPELISAATRQVIAAAAAYVDRTSEQGVVAFQEERDRRLQWRLSMVNEAGMRIGTTLDIVRTTQELADHAVEHFADLVTVDLLEAALQGQEFPGDGPLLLRRTARASVTDDGQQSLAEAQQLRVCPEGSPEARALVTGRPAKHHGDAAADAPHVHSTLIVPLRARGTTLGIARFCRNHNPRRYDDEDLLLAQEIAARAAVAVDNARRYSHVRATALTLQRSLLPRGAPRLSAVEVAYRYLPAGDRVGVGGDWYDVIPLSGARVALVVGDVVGHGIHAAATMGRLRTAVRTLADIDLPPDELLTHLDDIVLRLAGESADDVDGEAAGDTGATCLYAVYDPVSRRFALARAGHVPPALVTPDGTPEILELPPGPPLGLGGLPFEAMELELPEGSLLALYTDGLVESRDHDVDAGLARLRQALAQPAPSLEAVCDHVVEALLPTRPDDDVALLLARTHALGAGQVATWELAAEPAAVARARSEVSRQLSDWGLEQLGFTAELIVSELVTNAIRYGRPPVRLRLIHDRALLCEVSDGSSTTPHLRRARVFDEGGRGLLLVAQLAERWGTRHARRGKTVWAELSDSAELPLLAFAED